MNKQGSAPPRAGPPLFSGIRINGSVCFCPWRGGGQAPCGHFWWTFSSGIHAPWSAGASWADRYGTSGTPPAIENQQTVVTAAVIIRPSIGRIPGYYTLIKCGLSTQFLKFLSGNPRLCPTICRGATSCVAAPRPSAPRPKGANGRGGAYLRRIDPNAPCYGPPRFSPIASAERKKRRSQQTCLAAGRLLCYNKRWIIIGGRRPSA